MENLSLKAERRTEKGKSVARSLRRAGLIPGVVYGINEATPLTVNPAALESLRWWRVRVAPGDSDRESRRLGY